MYKTIAAKNIVKHELLGLRVKAKNIRNGTVHEGEVVGETMKTLKILRDDGRIVTLPKDSYLFEFILPNNEKILVEGVVLISRPEDRLKKKVRRW